MARLFFGTPYKRCNLQSASQATDPGETIRMQDKIRKLAKVAGKSAAAGNWDEAERLWKRITKLDPANPVALCSLAVHSLQRGDIPTALELLESSRSSSPRDQLTLMTLAAAHRQSRDADKERDAIDAALDVNPNFVPGLLAKGDWMERHSTAAAAAAMYRAALLLSPTEPQWPAEFRERLVHAKNYVSRHSAGLFRHLHNALNSDVQELSPGIEARWREAIAIRAGQSASCESRSNQLHVPRLPAIPFYDRNAFPFLQVLEDQTDKISAELAELVANHSDSFEPYIAYQPGEPVNQWHKLNHSRDWGAFHLWRSGQAVEENLQRCPETARTLREMPLAGIDGLCPNVFFSSLQPHTHIPPHHGESNARLIAHLPLLVPERCRLRVGFDEREWKVGEVLIFDDTIMHEAINDSDDLRVVLIFDLWNPLLTQAERELTSKLARATREYSA
jgi:aspartyl/asparaginyl beta-hydroxylase (cupin superfamily)